MESLSYIIGFVSYKCSINKIVDKSGEPYFLHLLSTMYLLPFSIDEENTRFKLLCRIVALLHDIVEDNIGDYTFDKLSYLLLYNTDLSEYDVDVVIESLKVLTHDKNTPYMTYIENIVKESDRLENIPIMVKYADMKHNTLPERLIKLDEETRNRLIKKYNEPFKLIENKINNINNSSVKVDTHLVPNYIYITKGNSIIEVNLDDICKLYRYYELSDPCKSVTYFGCRHYFNKDFYSDISGITLYYNNNDLIIKQDSTNITLTKYDLIDLLDELIKLTNNDKLNQYYTLLV